jgi:hypothetical protein
MTLSQVQNVHRVIRDILSRQQEYNFALNECMKQTDTSYTLAKKEIGQIIAEYTNQPYEIGDIENNKKIYEDMLIVPHEDLFTNLSKRLVKYSQDENHF